jgi:hypothetical protein
VQSHLLPAVLKHVVDGEKAVPLLSGASPVGIRNQVRETGIMAGKDPQSISTSPGGERPRVHQRQTVHASETGPSAGGDRESRKTTEQSDERNATRNAFSASSKAQKINIKRKASSAPKHAETEREKKRVEVEYISDSRDAEAHGNVKPGRDGSTRTNSSVGPRGAKAPRFPMGTRFRKNFPGYGTFQGTIESFDGEYYRVYYPSDGDAEDLSDSELDEVEIIETPASRAATE